MNQNPLWFPSCQKALAAKDTKVGHMASLQVLDGDSDISEEEAALVTIKVFQPLVEKVFALHDQHRLNICPVQVRFRAPERVGTQPQLQSNAIRIR